MVPPVLLPVLGGGRAPRLPFGEPAESVPRREDAVTVEQMELLNPSHQRCQGTEAPREQVTGVKVKQVRR